MREHSLGGNNTMTSYKHITTGERELIFLYSNMGYSIHRIGKLLKRSASTISRELRRHSGQGFAYSPSNAQRRYNRNKKKCGSKRLLDTSIIKPMIQTLFIDYQWLPEQISNRLKLECPEEFISYNTIYRAVYRGDFNHCVSVNSRGALTKLRRRGKKYGIKKYQDGRGHFYDARSIHDWPDEAIERKECGHWEADTVLGKAGKACVVTLVDRKSRFLLIGKAERKKAVDVASTIKNLLSSIPMNQRKTLTPDRGQEFAHYERISTENHIDCYFADPSSPWQRGTNENTNGLVREYLPKSVDMTPIFDDFIESVAFKINNRPRKCLGWKTPYEVFYKKVLHLI